MTCVNRYSLSPKEFFIVNLSSKLTFIIPTPPMANQPSPKLPPQFVPTHVVVVPLEFVWWSNLFVPLLRLFYFVFSFGERKKMSSNTTLISRIDSFVYSNHIVSIQKIDGSNYSTWASKSGFGYVG